MKSDNDLTLDSYNERLKEYIEGTPKEVSSDFKSWIDRTLALIDTDSSILELGSGFGRDADYFESKGYRVQRSDGSSAFVQYLTAQGKEAKLLNVVTDEIDGPYDLVFANAVLLHLQKKEMKSVLNKVHNSLSNGGILSFSLKRGDGSEWSDAKLGAKRFFQYWQLSEVLSLLESCVFDVIYSSDQAEGGKWIHVIAKKR